MNRSGRSWESVELDARPGLRDAVMRMTDFQEWRDSLSSIELDGECFYLPWGDVPMDEDQILYQFARSHGLVHP